MKRLGWTWLAVIIIFGGGAEAPAADTQIDLRANVMMLCGCPSEPGGLWDANAFEVVALIRQRDRRVAEVTLSYAGEIGQFKGVFPIPGPGPYDITVYAFDPGNGNTGLDRATIVVAEAAAAADED
jgi:hypothetical protein